MFQEIFAEKPTTPKDEQEIPKVSRQTYYSIKMITFWPKHVRKFLSKLDINKATGPDSIPANKQG